MQSTAMHPFRLIRRALPALLAILLAAAAAIATTMRPKDVDCPVCEKRVTVQVIGSWTGGGCDGDLGPRVRGGSVLPFQVWTCPGCRYSAWAGDFPKGPKPETRERIRKGLEPPAPVAADADQRDIPAWAKYDLAARVMDWDGAPDSSREWLLLNGAWAVRQDSARARRALLEDPDLAARFDAAWEKVHREANTVKAPPGETLLLSLVRDEAAAAAAERAAASERAAGRPDPLADLVAACLHRSIGENAAAGPILAHLKADESAPAPVRDAATAVAASIARERAFQERALTLLTSETRPSDESPEKRAASRITAADTLRRLGRGKDAVALFLEAARDADVPAWAVAFARHGLARSGAGEEAPSVLAAAEARAREGLRKKLLDPGEAMDAARLVGDSDDSAFFPDLVAALAHESKVVREAALVGFHRMDRRDLPPEAVAALEKVVRTRKEEPRLKESAISRLSEEAAPCCRALFREASSWASSRIRGEALEGIARCGTEEDVPVLLDFLARGKGIFQDFEFQGCLRTLTILANREIRDEEVAIAWWQKAKWTRREEWAVEGFRGAGAAIDSLRGREAIPALLGLLDQGKPWVRFNALRALREETGQRFGWDRNTHVWNRDESQGLFRDGTPAFVDEWRAWWAAESKKR